MRLNENFYKENALKVAPMLLGKLLCRKVGTKVLRLRITETECYLGEEDTACHAHKGRTPRTETMYHAGGVAYVYLCYGMHHLLNIVTGNEGCPEAVLVRAVEGFDGPGKLTKALQVTKELNGEDLVNSRQLWLEDDGFLCDFRTEKRVGIAYATKEYRDKLWRFVKAKD